MNRRTAIKSMLGSGLLLGGCSKQPTCAKRISIADNIKLRAAIAQVESRHIKWAVGAHGEIGIYQIGEEYVEDVNRIIRLYHICDETYDSSDRLSQGMANGMMSIYWGHYATVERLGHEPTLQDLARIHNGGPNGYKKQATKVYWEKVKVELAKM